MSRTYRCRVKKDIQLTHTTSDEIEYKIDLQNQLGILAPEEMEKEYRKTLKNMGAYEDEDHNLVLDINGIKITVNTREKTAKAKLEDKAELKAETEKAITVYDYDDDQQKAQKKAEQKLESTLKNELETIINQQKNEHTQKTKEKLSAADEKIRQALRKAANHTYKNALRKKAGRMGRITQDKEERLDNGNERLTLEVELA